jgi:hypothetical protein
MTEATVTHQQRWRRRLRATHDRLDVYLPKSLSAAIRRQVTGDLTVSDYVERCLTQAMDGNRAPALPAALATPAASLPNLSPETIAHAAERAAAHGVSLDDFLLAAMRGVSSQTTVMIRGLASAGRRDALAAGRQKRAGAA